MSHFEEVFTLTEAMRSELVRRGVKHHKIALLPNACNPEKFQIQFDYLNSHPEIDILGTNCQCFGSSDLVSNHPTNQHENPYV